MQIRGRGGSKTRKFCGRHMYMIPKCCRGGGGGQGAGGEGGGGGGAEHIEMKDLNRNVVALV